MSLSALAALLLVPVAALAAPATFDELMAQARAAYDEAAFDVALGELLAAEAVARDDAERTAVRLTQGLVLASIPNLEAARVKWEGALALQPDAALPWPAPPKVRAEFEKVMQTARRLRPAPADPPPPVPPLLVAEAEPLRPAPSKPWAVPIVGAALSTAGLGLGIGFGTASRGTLSQLQATPWEDERERLYGRASSEAMIATVALAVAGAFAVIAMVSLLLVALR